MLKELSCLKCGAPVRVPGGDLEQRLVGCEFCGTTFILDLVTEEPPPKGKPAKGAKRAKGGQGRSLQVSSRHGGVLFVLTEKQLKIPKDRPSATAIKLENEPGSRFFAHLPAKSRTAEDLSTAHWMLSIMFLIGAGLLAVGIWRDSWWWNGAGIVGLLIFLVFLLAEWSMRYSEEIRIQGGVVHQLRKKGDKRKEHQVPWRQIDKIEMPIYLNLRGKDREIDLAINASDEERRWLFEELRRYASGLTDDGQVP